MISISVMAHPKRLAVANKLKRKLELMPFDSVQIVFDDGTGEWETGKRALEAHSDALWHIVVQDDAIIPETFYYNVQKALENVPSESLISFYLGQVRPFPRQVSQAFQNAMDINASWLQAKTLYWGVCICIPVKHINPMLKTVKNSQLLYDQRIGSYFNKMKLPVYYTTISLADHNYKLSSLTGHDYRKEPRIAHCYIGEDIVDNWNSEVVHI